MITLLATLALTTPATLAEAPREELLPFTWQGAELVRVNVSETRLKASVEYSLEIKLFKNEQGGGLTIARKEFEAKSVAGRDVTEPEQREPYREWIVRMENFPNLRVDAGGSFESFSSVKEAEARFFAEMSKGLAGAELAAARLDYGPGVDRALWSEPLRQGWQSWAEAWTGLPLTPGIHSVDRKLYLGMPGYEQLDVKAQVTVGEPYEADGQRHVRIESVVRLNDENMGVDSVRFLNFIGATPSLMQNLQGFETFFRSEAVFDTKTWLPVEVHALRQTRVGMETTRSAWVEEFIDEHRYGFEWTLREEG